jgi:hypothetical protein
MAASRPYDPISPLNRRDHVSVYGGKAKRIMTLLTSLGTSADCMGLT